MRLLRTFRLLLALAVALSLFAPVRALPIAQAKGEDVCPEPNDDFQAACYLGPGADALGFISNPDDIDAYRFETFDFDTTSHVEIADQPVPYQFVVADWNGDEIGRSRSDGNREVADIPLKMPGSYYIFVQAKTGQFSDSAPYRILTRINYPGAAPAATYRGDFRAGSLDVDDTSRQTVDYIRSGGKLTIAGKVNGSRESWAGGTYWLDTTGDEFTITFDARVQSGKQAGYRLQFGGTGNTNDPFKDSFQLIVQTFTQQAVLGQYAGTEYKRLAGWQASPAIYKDNRVNRTTVDARNGNVRVVINGVEVLSWAGKVPAGRFAIGSSSWDDPAVISFDNVIATAPSTRAAPGSVLASDNFDDPANAILLTTTPDPNRFTRSYDGGEYVMRFTSLDPNGDLSVSSLPFQYDDATLAIDGRIVGNPTGHYLFLACRQAEVTKDVFGGYSAVVYPADGRVGLRRILTSTTPVTIADQVVPAVQRGNASNHVEMTCQGSTIALKVNGTEVLSVQDNTYKRGYMYIGHGALRGSPEPGEARFDNLSVTQR
ncbi:MAG: hypothetical protein U0893_12515 [Chloroflexota bacterium]